MTSRHRKFDPAHPDRQCQCADCVEEIDLLGGNLFDGPPIQTKRRPTAKSIAKSRKRKGAKR